MSGGYGKGNSYYSYKTWSGGDGKYVVPGNLSWNNYTMSGGQGYQNGSAYNQWLNIDGISVNFDMTNFNIALGSKIASAIRAHDFQMGNFIAEGHQTVEMVVQAVVKLGKCARHLRHGRLDLAARTLGTSSPLIRKIGRGPNRLVREDIGNFWLELQYGWRPLLSDVHESMQAYHKLASGVHTTYGKVSKRITASSRILDPYTYDQWAVGDYSRQVIFKLSSPISAPASLGLTDPLSVAWEVIPYSFVVDWFLPIGSYLDAIHTLGSVTGTYLTTVRTRVHTNKTCNYLKTPSGMWNEYFGVNVSYDAMNLTRSVSSEYSIPCPQVGSLSLSTGHFYNALALLSQYLGK